MTRAEQSTEASKKGLEESDFREFMQVVYQEINDDQNLGNFKSLVTCSKKDVEREFPERAKEILESADNDYTVTIEPRDSGKAFLMISWPKPNE